MISSRRRKTPAVLSSRSQNTARSKTVNSTPRTIRINTKSTKGKKSFVKRDVDIYEEPEYLYDKFLKLSQEIAEIQCQVKPLRADYIRLQNEILSKQQTEGVEHENNDRLIKEGDFQSAIFKFQNESTQMQRQLLLIRQSFSPNEIIRLQEEESDTKRAIDALNMDIAQMDLALDKYHSQMDQFKRSHLHNTVQRQKEDIQNVTQELQNEIEKHEKLKAQRDIFEESDDDMKTLAEEVNTISRLKRKLETARRTHYEKCEILLALRNKQLKEIESVKTAIPRNKELEKALSNIHAKEPLLTFGK